MSVVSESWSQWAVENRFAYLGLAIQGLLEFLTGLASRLDNIVVGHELVIHQSPDVVYTPCGLTYVSRHGEHTP